MVSLIPGVNIALASNILISAFVGVLSVLHDYKKESKDFIGKNKSIISVTCAIVGGMALGIGATIFFTYKRSNSDTFSWSSCRCIRVIYK